MSSGSDQRLNVLLVDDDAVVRQTIEQGLLNEPRLKARGIRIVGAGSGKRALGQIQSEMPNVAIIDLFMPKMDGFELCRAIRAEPETMDLPLVVFSGVFAEDDRVKELTSETSAVFVAKPASAAALADAVLAVMGEKTGEHPVRPPKEGPQARADGESNDISRRDFSPGAVTEWSSSGPVRHTTMMGMPVGPAISTFEALPHDGGLLALRELPSPVPPPITDTASPTTATNNIDKADPPVPRLLMEHLEKGSTGTLVLQRGQMRKEIFIVKGEAVSAMSNLRQESLGRLLIAGGILVDDQLTFLLEEMKRQGEKMGSVLVSLGWLSPEDVLRYLLAQARKRIVDALRYVDVAHEFVAGDDFLEREIEHDLDMPRLMFMGLKKTSAPDVLVEKLPREHGASILSVGPNLQKHAEVLKEVFGDKIIDQLLEGPRVSTLMTQPDVATILPALEAVTLCGLAFLERADHVIPMAEVLEDAARSTMTLESLGDTGKVQSAPHALEIDLDQNSAPVPHDIDADQGAAPTPILMEDSGVITVDAVATVSGEGGSSSAALPSQGVEAQRGLVLQEYLQMKAKNYYQLLGIERGANIDEIVVAFEAATRKFAPDVFSGVDLGSDASKLESIRATYARAFKVLGDVKVRGEYDAKQGQQRSDDTGLLDAELAFGEAKLALDEGNAADAIPKLQAAVIAAPNQADYRAYLGWAIFKAYGDAAVGEARARLEEALLLDPAQVDTHDFLGQIAIASGDEETARISLEKALELDPTRLHCLELLAPIQANYSEFHATERIYKRLIRALGDRHIALRRKLWLDLAKLYEEEFDDQASARIAYEMAARLSPDDSELQRKVVELNASDLDRWKDIARALTAEWRLNPGDGEVANALVDLLLRVGKNDAATVAAAAMVVRGLADKERESLARGSAPRLLTRLSQSIDAEILSRVRHGGEDPDIETLFATLSSAGIIAPFSDADVGVFGEAPIPEDDQPEGFRRVLEYVCEVLKVRPPVRVFEMESLGGDARLADTHKPALFVGPDLLESVDTVELGFRLGRAMSFGTPGRLTGASRSGRQLKPYLLACMAYARQALSQGEIEVVPIVEEFERLDATIRKRLSDLGQRLSHHRPSINVSAWARALNRTATRLGLLICGDLERVGRIVADEEGPEALDELLEFALSLDHLDLREELGISSVL